MKRLMILLPLISIGLIIYFLITPVNKNVQIYSINMAHQHIHTSDLETMTFPVLINQDKSVFMVHDAIIDSYLLSEDSLERVPITIESIEKTHKQPFKGSTYFGYTINASISIITEDHLIHLKEASLILHYQDDMTLTIPIGEMAYAFKSLESNHLHVYDRINLSHKIGETPSSMGMVLSIENKTMNPISIKEITLISSHILPNLYELETLNQLNPDALKLTDYFHETIYLSKNASLVSPLIIEAYEEAIYAIPFSYLDLSLVMHQYPLIITYQMEGKTYEAIFDDFRFIKTNHFNDSEEAIYEQATIDKN